MATRNAYLAYKRDTSRLLYWIIGASNAIIKFLQGTLNLGDGCPLEMNTTGEITVTGLVALSKLIAQHTPEVPATILRLFQSVIDARTSAYAAFQNIATGNPDPEVKKSNRSHKHFIDALTEAFHALGGGTWMNDHQEDHTNFDNDDTYAKDELDRLMLQNKFGALGLGEIDEEVEGPGDEERAASCGPQRRRQARPGRGNKRRRGTKTRKQEEPAAAVKGPSLDDLPLEKYRLIQDTDGTTNDFMMAAHAFSTEWAELRVYVQDVWRDCAFYGMNSAVAGAVSNLVIAMVQQTASAIFIDFPDHDDFGTIIDFLTHGDPEAALSDVDVWLVEVMAVAPGHHKSFYRTVVDMKEQLMLYTYRDFVDFLKDFQKTRSGKPTKRMLADLRDWDPEFNLQGATNEQRIQWRRRYTINWLYDLVNVFSSVVVQRNAKGERHVVEDIDWSPQGPWHKHRRLFGLNEFAGLVTSLAMQKEGTDIRRRILPHHVFQLQCIVDSFAVSRGWSISAFRGHVLTEPAPNFRPKQDIDLFLHPGPEGHHNGFIQEVDAFEKHLCYDACVHQDPNRNPELAVMVEGLQREFGDWLGETKCIHGLPGIPASRFSSSNANGLWEYSPFLCGVGLIEALDIAYLASMHIWEQIPEPMLMMHLHSMLITKGYIKEPMPLLAALHKIFVSGFFGDVKCPKSDFAQELRLRVDTITSRRPRSRRATARNNDVTSSDTSSFLAPHTNRFFKPESILSLFRQSNWNVDSIPDAAIPFEDPMSHLAFLRISRAKRVVDPVTGQKRFEDRDLVKRVAQGLEMSEESMLTAARAMTRTEASLADTGLDDWSLPKSDPAAGQFIVPVDDCKQGHNWRHVLGLYKKDLFNDVCGWERPIAAINYLAVTNTMMAQFAIIEELLGEPRNELYVRAYETDSCWRRQKRVGLSYLALKEQDDECLKAMALVMENLKAYLMHHIYWGNLEDVEDWLKARCDAAYKKDDKVDDCRVM